MVGLSQLVVGLAQLVVGLAQLVVRLSQLVIIPSQLVVILSQLVVILSHVVVRPSRRVAILSKLGLQPNVAFARELHPRLLTKPRGLRGNGRAIEVNMRRYN